MAKAASRKLKVFQTQIGFYDIVIATPSKAAALRAWGTRQDLFAQGIASPVTNPEVEALALAHPEMPLRRPVGSNAQFSLDPARPKIADMGASAGQPAEDGPDRNAKPQKPPPDRRKLDAAEAKLASLASERDAEETRLADALTALEAEEAALRDKRRALESETQEHRETWQRRLGKAEDAVERERQAYRKAGGED